MTALGVLESVGRRLPAPVARVSKRVAVYPRYLAQAQACRRGFREFGDRYPQQVLFIAGLPKSGTTWLESMVASYPGFHEVTIPSVYGYELATGGTHDYELPHRMFSRFRQMLVVTKLHVHGSPHNVGLLRDAGVRCVILYRDLRDVAVSHVFYVRRTPWHPEYPLYSKRSPQEGLSLFAERTLSPFVDWVRSWHENAGSDMSLFVRYEDMLSDTVGVMTRIAEHFQLDASGETISTIVGRHSFEAMSGGRSPGQRNDASFFRTGVSGDWRNYFTPELTEMFTDRIGDSLEGFGYERDPTF
ncbi:MAG: sulfotransferase domain-containing protein [Actinomycetota bacterium]|nr:sulfotransferase domain-containing protein [Actinomycetota bacterium]